MSHYKHMNKKTKQNKTNWHIACCAANKTSLSTTLQSCELFIPTPAQFSGTSGSCTQFLHQCFLVFDQQWQTSATDMSKTVFMLDLLTDKAACLGSHSFTVETHTPSVFFYLWDDKGFWRSLTAGSQLLSLRQPRITVPTSAFWPLSAYGPNPHFYEIFRHGLCQELDNELALHGESTGLEELIILTICLDNSLEEKRRKRMASWWWASLTARSPLGARQRGLIQILVWMLVAKHQLHLHFQLPLRWLRSVGTLEEGQHLGLCFYCKQLLRSAKVFEPVVNRGMLVSWDRESSPCVQLLGILSFFSIFCFPDIYKWIQWQRITLTSCFDMTFMFVGIGKPEPYAFDSRLITRVSNCTVSLSLC